MCRSRSGRFVLVVAVVTAGACAQPGIDLPPKHDLGHSGADAGPPPQEDLAGVDLASQDLTSGDDAAVPVDLASVDLTISNNADLASQCKVIPQSGCSAGQKCTVVAANQTACEPDGTVANGGACGAGSSDDCIHGAMCVSDNMGAAGSLLCRAFCNSDADCTQPAAGPAKNTAHCLDGLTGDPTKLCTFACNPVTAAGPSGCPGNLACGAFSSTTVAEFTDCGTQGTGKDGANCKTNGTTDCAPGFTCVDNGLNQVCRESCRAGRSSDCVGVSNYTCFLPTGSTMFGLCCPALGGC
jgi:hypothetical protein